MQLIERMGNWFTTELSDRHQSDTNLQRARVSSLILKSGFHLDYHLRRLFIDLATNPHTNEIRVIEVGLDFDRKCFRLIYPIHRFHFGWRHDYNCYIHTAMNVGVPCYIFLQLDLFDHSYSPEWVFIFYAPNRAMGAPMNEHLIINLESYVQLEPYIRETFSMPIIYSYKAECETHLKLARIVEIVDRARLDKVVAAADEEEEEKEEAVENGKTSTKLYDLLKKQKDRMSTKFSIGKRSIRSFSLATTDPKMNGASSFRANPLTPIPEESFQNRSFSLIFHIIDQF